MRLAAIGVLIVGTAWAQDGEERLDPSSTLPVVSKPLVRPDSVRLPAFVPPLQILVTARDSNPPTLLGADSTTSRDSVQVKVSPLSVADSSAKKMTDSVKPSIAAEPAPKPVVMAVRSAVVVGLDTTTHAARRSVWAAAGLSLLLPGAGEQYLGATSRAKVFFATELVSVAAAWLSYRNREDALVSAREIASRYAGADAQDKSIEFLELMGQYRSRRPVGSRHDSHDEAMLLSGQSPERQFPNTDSYTWDWGSTENPENDAHLRTFESQLRTYRASKVALSFSIGAMGVSRILSLADVLWLHRRASWFQAEVTPLPQGAAGRLAWRF